MNAKDIMFLLFALAAGAGILYYIIQPSFLQADKKPIQIELLSPPSAKENETFSVTLNVQNAQGKTIYLSTEQKTISLSCETNSCSFSEKLSFPASGKQVIRARIDAETAEKTIRIFSDKKVCLDATPEENCSLQKPLYCQDAQLVSNCTRCGCPSSQVCSTNTCISLPYSFSLEFFDFPTAIYPAQKVSIPIRVVNISAYPAEGIFILFLEMYDAQQKKIKEIPQQVRISSLKEGETIPLSVEAVFSASTKFIEARIHGENAPYLSENALGKTSGLKSVNILVDTTSPEKPTHLLYSISGKEATLTWNPSPSNDISTYVIYQQNTAAGGFTTYSTLGETNQTVFTVSLGNEATAYVVAAKDYAGNQSEASNPVVVPAT